MRNAGILVLVFGFIRSALCVRILRYVANVLCSVQRKRVLPLGSRSGPASATYVQEPVVGVMV